MTIICAKQQEDKIKKAFPKAKGAYYLGLERRNDLENETTILAGAVPVNLPAVLLPNRLSSVTMRGSEPSNRSINA